MALLNQPHHQVRWREPRPQLPLQVVGNPETHVQADHVGQPQRSGRVAVAEGHRGVDVVRRGDPFLDHPDRLQPERDPEAAAGEAGGVPDDDRCLAQLLHPGHGPLAQIRRRGGGDDDLDQLAGGHGVEEMEPQQSLRPGKRLRQGVQRDAARVGGYDGVGSNNVLDRAQRRQLQVQILGNSFHHKPDSGEVAVTVHRAKPGHHLARILDLTPLDADQDGTLHPLPGSRRRFLISLHQVDLGAGQQECVGDAGAHAPTTHDPAPVRQRGAGLLRPLAGDHLGHVSPPVASITAPVTHPESAAHSMSTAPAMSSGVPSRRMALAPDIASMALGEVPRPGATDTEAPGRTTFTVIPRAATSLAATRAAASRPALAAAYVLCRAGASCAAARQSTYVAAKAGLEAAARVAAKEVAARGITVNVVRPGATDTEALRRGTSPKAIEAMSGANAMRRLGTPDDIAGAVLMLCAADSGWVTGAVIDATGGLT